MRSLSKCKGISIIFIFILICPIYGWEGSQDRCGVKLIFLIDVNDLMCISCLESLLEFCDSLPDETLKERSFGIMMVGKKETEKSFRIVQKKLNCFVKTNQIKFPVHLDRSSGNCGFEINGSAVICIDFKNNVIRKFKFPLSRFQKTQIFSVISGHSE